MGAVNLVVLSLDLRKHNAAIRSSQHNRRFSTREPSTWPIEVRVTPIRLQVAIEPTLRTLGSPCRFRVGAWNTAFPIDPESR